MVEDNAAKLTYIDLRRVKSNLSFPVGKLGQSSTVECFPSHPQCHQGSGEITRHSEGKMKGNTREGLVVAAVWVPVHMRVGEIKDMTAGK